MPNKAELIAEIRSKQGSLNSGTAEAQRQALLQEVKAKRLAEFEAEERKFADQSYIEDKLGGELVYGQEIPNFWLQRGISVREELNRAVDWANASGYLPEGGKAYGVQDMNGENFVAYKLNGDNKFYAINDPGPSLGDWGSEFGASVISAESLLGVLGEVLLPHKKLVQGARMAYRFGRLATRSMRVGTFTGVGRGGDEFLEGFDDEDAQTYDAIMGKMVESGFLGAGAHMFLGEPFEIVAGKLKRHGFSVKDLLNLSKEEATPQQIKDLADALNVRPEVLEDAAASHFKDINIDALVEATARQELPVLGLGDVGSPVAKRAQTQAAGVSSEAAAKEKAKLSGPAQVMIESKYNVDSITELNDTALEKVVEQHEKEAVVLMNRAFSEKGIDFSSTTKEVGGKAAAETVLDYRKTSSVAGKRKYDKVFDIATEEGIVYDVSDVVEQAVVETQTLKLAGREKTVTDKWTDPRTWETVEETTTVVEDVEIPSPLEGKLEQIALSLTKINDMQGPERLTALRQVRTRLMDLVEPNQNRLTATPGEAAARRILDKLTEAVNGTSNTGSDAYRAAVKDANAFWTQRAANLDAFSYMANTNTLGAGEKIYTRLFNGTLTDEEAKFLINNMPPNRLKEFRSAFYTDMQRHPEKIDSMIRGLDRAGESIIPENAKKVLVQYRRDYEKLNKSLAARLLNEQYLQGERIGVLIDKGDVADIRSLIDNGVMTREDVSRGVVHDFIAKTTDYDDGKFIINRSKYENTFKNFEERGVFKLMDKEARTMLADLRVYASFLPKGADSGDSIASASIASDLLRSVSNPIGGVKAGLRIAQLTMASRLAHSPTLLKVLKGKEGGYSFPVSRAVLLSTAVELRNLSQDHTKDYSEEPNQ